MRARRRGPALLCWRDATGPTVQWVYARIRDTLTGQVVDRVPCDDKQRSTTGHRDLRSAPYTESVVFCARTTHFHHNPAREGVSAPALANPRARRATRRRACALARGAYLTLRAASAVLALVAAPFALAGWRGHDEGQIH